MFLHVIFEAEFFSIISIFNVLPINIPLFDVILPLINISELDFYEQKMKLDDELREWKGELEQVDDIMIVGFKIE